MNTIHKDQDEIVIKLLNITSRFIIHTNALKQDMIHEPLLGQKFRLTARELVYLLYEVEKEFNIKISQEDICSGNFNSVKRIADIIYSTSFDKAL